MFEDEYKNANDRLHHDRGLDEKILNAMNEAPAARSGGFKKLSRSKGFIAAAAAVLCVLFVAPAIFGIAKLASSHRNAEVPSAGEVSAFGSNHIITLKPDAKPQNASALADDYSEVYAKLSSSLTPYDGDPSSFWDDLRDIFYFNGGYYKDDLVYEAAPMPEAADAPTYGDGDSLNTSGNYHSNTNTQVEGVDEADIIKTDGRYIYVLNNKGVSILTADGADSVLVARINAEDMPRHHEDSTVGFYEMYLAGDKLVVIGDEYLRNKNFYDIPEGVDGEDAYYYGAYMWYFGSSVTDVLVYDISNVNEPALESSLCLDGYYKDSRVTDGRLYVITNYSPFGLICENEPCTYVPCKYDGEGNCILTPADDIRIIESDDDEQSYIYVAALELDNSADFSGTLAILGRVDTVYCSTGNLYLTSSGTDYVTEEIRFDFVDGVPVRSENGSEKGTYENWSEYTDIMRIKLGSSPVLATVGRVDGTLINQFAMDEYNGYLRVVTDIESWANVVQEFDNDYSCYSLNSVDNNGLFVLDMNLNVVGSIEDIGVGEHVKSVRFMGGIGYVVTFRQTDPLFSIDLTDPASPKVLGELHIPGFSEYLHSWNGDMLFGLGQMADEYTGGTTGLKLSMFDVSDPSDVRELYCCMPKDVHYSTAEYNHKAILVAPDRGIIGFPAGDTGYLIYSFDPETGFTQSANIRLGANSEYELYDYDMRGLYAGDYYYVISADSGRMAVIDLNSFSVVGTVRFTDGIEFTD